MFPTPSRESAPYGRRPDWLTVAFLLGGILLLYYGLPLVALLAAQSPTVLLDRLGSPTVTAAATNSLLTAAVTTVLATAFGVPLAYWLARADSRWTAPVTALVVLPLVLPPTVGGLLLLTVVGPRTLLGDAGAAVGLPLTRSLAGIVLAQTFVASPFVVVTAKAAFEGVDCRLEQASRSLGKRRWTTFRRVTVPLAWPGILAGMTLAFARAIGEFGATLMLAFHPRTMPVQIWVAFQERGVANAFPVAIILVAVAVVVLALLGTLGTDPWRR